MVDEQERERLIEEIKQKIELLLQADSVSEEEKLFIIEEAFKETGALIEWRDSNG